MSGLTLGFMGKSITKDDNNAHGSLISKIGGIPYWLNNKIPDIPECHSCNKSLTFVCQLYTPYDSKVKRMIYIFGCLNSKSCFIDPSSWKVIRGCIEVQTANKDILRNHDEPNSPFSKLEDPIKPQSISYPVLNEAFSSTLDNNFFIDSLAPPKRPINHFFSLKTPKKQHSLSHPKESKNLKGLTKGRKHVQFPPILINEVENDGENEDFKDNLDLRAQILLDEFRKKEEDGTLSNEDKMDQDILLGSKAWDNEEFERTSNKEFLRFQKELRRYPDQIIRYCFGGKPISPRLNSSKNKIPNCEVCNSQRFFEFQILPTIFYQLISRHKKDFSLHFPELKLESTFGSLIIHSCSSDCIPNNTYTLEHMSIELEPV